VKLKELYTVYTPFCIKALRIEILWNCLLADRVLPKDGPQREAILRVQSRIKRGLIKRVAVSHVVRMS